MSTLEELCIFAETYEPPKEQPLRRTRELMSCAVIENPSLAGTGVDVGNWEAGEIGACTLVYPTLKQAQEYERSPW